MKYDIRFVMPICSKEGSRNYKNRFFDFKRYGLLNTKNSNICVALLIHQTDNFTQQDLLEGWRENITVETVLHIEIL